jgi:hypothetical protein
VQQGRGDESLTNIPLAASGVEATTSSSVDYETVISLGETTPQIPSRSSRVSSTLTTPRATLPTMTSLLVPLFNAAFDQANVRPESINVEHWNRWAQIFRQDFERRGITYLGIVNDPTNYDRVGRNRHLRANVQNRLFYTISNAPSLSIHRAVNEINLYFQSKDLPIQWFVDAEIATEAMRHLQALDSDWVLPGGVEARIEDPAPPGAGVSIDTVTSITAGTFEDTVAYTSDISSRSIATLATIAPFGLTASSADDSITSSCAVRNNRSAASSSTSSSSRILPGLDIATSIPLVVESKVDNNERESKDIDDDDYLDTEVNEVSNILIDQEASDDDASSSDDDASHSINHDAAPPNAANDRYNMFVSLFQLKQRGFLIPMEIGMDSVTIGREEFFFHQRYYHNKKILSKR